MIELPRDHYAFRSTVRQQHNGKWRTSGDEHGHVEGLHEAHGLRVARNAEVEGAQAVTLQGIRT